MSFVQHVMFNSCISENLWAESRNKVTGIKQKQEIGETEMSSSNVAIHYKQVS